MNFKHLNKVLKIIWKIKYLYCYTLYLTLFLIKNKIEDLSYLIIVSIILNNCYYKHNNS